MQAMDWPSLVARREQVSLAIYKILSGKSLDTDKYLTSAPNLGRAKTSHDSKFTRCLTYSDSLKKYYHPRTTRISTSLKLLFGGLI